MTCQSRAFCSIALTSRTIACPLRSCIARFTFADAFLPYFLAIDVPCDGESDISSHLRTGAVHQSGNRFRLLSRLDAYELRDFLPPLRPPLRLADLPALEIFAARV